MMWLYEGRRDPNVPGHKNVTIFQQGGGQTVLRHYIVRHSPDGFNWGYGGAGPCDLALNMLFDCLKRDSREEIEARATAETYYQEIEARATAETYYQEFKREFIEPALNHLKINSRDILDWIELKEAEKSLIEGPKGD